MTNMMMSGAQFERRRLGERTREGMAKTKEQTGKHMGRQTALPLDTALYVHRLREEGLSLQKIAARLIAEEVATAKGRHRHASTVKAVLESATLRRALPE